MKDAAVFLQHIRDSIVRIEPYTAHRRRAFLADTMVQDAVIRSIRDDEVLTHDLGGEATTSEFADHVAKMVRG